mmetsp:Transcript_19802/g.52091  ORF Transcript_19802/g.52091 Transcript_19802/m.52091 type:complete len:190 (+) Transcript_19802:296-865(+)
MSPEAFAAMMAVLTEVGATLWEPLHRALAEHGGAVGGDAQGAAGAFPVVARLEAVSKVLGNHFALLLDNTNPTRDLGVLKPSLTQTNLTRVPHDRAAIIDENLREAVRRLQGFDPPQQLDASPGAEEARAISLVYMKTRIQSKADQMPGRAPDMSPEAAAALIAVLAELAGEGEKVEEGVSRSTVCVLL